MSVPDQFIDPSREQFEQFKALDRDRPILMLNLLRFKEQAHYPDDHPCAGEVLTGLEAYRRYSKAIAPIVERIGARIATGGRFDCMVIGPDDKHWHSVFMVHYPSANAFLEMITDPEYQRAVIHRTAAVETSRLMRLDPGDGFDFE